MVVINDSPWERPAYASSWYIPRVGQSWTKFSLSYRKLQGIRQSTPGWVADPDEIRIRPPPSQKTGSGSQLWKHRGSVENTLAIPQSYWFLNTWSFWSEIFYRPYIIPPCRKKSYNCHILYNRIFIYRKYRGPRISSFFLTFLTYNFLKVIFSTFRTR